MAPMPSDSEKNIWPAADLTTSKKPLKVLRGSKLGLKMNL